MDRFDNQLIVDYFKGDEKSLEILIRQYLRPIYSFIYRYVGNTSDAEDITQEVFVRMWRNLKKFDQNRSFKTWIFSIAKNASIDFLKKKKAIPFSRFEDEEGRNVFLERLVDKAPLPNEIFEQADITKILTSVIDKLSSQYRIVLFLRYNDHFNFREIAEVLGEPLHTVKSRHRRALIQLKKLLTEP
jgi:RNA polymerase sigma-70 factor (ECF subfamily)